MGISSKTVTLATMIAGGAMFSQSPEFAQQYKQRIGGAIEELTSVVENFDADAKASEMSRTEALTVMSHSKDKLIQDRATSMRKAINRFTYLTKQKEQLDKAGPLEGPLYVLQYPDQKLFKDAWADYEPAVPVTTAGAAYGGFGALIFGFFARLLVLPFKRRTNKSAIALQKAANEGQQWQ